MTTSMTVEVVTEAIALQSAGGTVTIETEIVIQVGES
jgi:hypothetical protein